MLHGQVLFSAAVEEASHPTRWLFLNLMLWGDVASEADWIVCFRAARLPASVLVALPTTS